MLKTQGLTPVTSEQAMAVAKKMGAQYMECSSKEMMGVDEIFERAIDTVVINDRRNVDAAMNAGSGSSRGGSKDGRRESAYGLSSVRAFKKKKRMCRPL